MFSKFAIVAALMLVGASASVTLADGPGGSGYETSTQGPTVSVSDNLHSSQANGHHDIIVCDDDGPGLGGGY